MSDIRTEVIALMEEYVGMGHSQSDVPTRDCPTPRRTERVDDIASFGYQAFANVY